MERAFKQDKQRCDEQLGKRDCDGFKECVKQAVRLYLWWDLARESRVCLIKAKLHRMRVQEHGLEQKIILCSYPYLTLTMSFKTKVVTLVLKPIAHRRIWP